MLEYIINVTEKKRFTTPEQFIEETIKALPDERSQVMTLAEELRMQGMQKGMLEGKKEVARNMLSFGHDLAVISEVTGFSTQELQQIL